MVEAMLVFDPGAGGVEVISTRSDVVLRNHDGGLASVLTVEAVSDELMSALLDLEESTHGLVSSAAVSAVASRAEISIEFTVASDTISDASEIAADAVSRAMSRIERLVDGTHSTETARLLLPA